MQAIRGMILKGKLVSTVIVTTLFFSCSNETKLTTTSQEALKYYNQGVDHLEKFYYAQAKEALEHAVQADSNFAMAYARLATVHNRTQNEGSANAAIAVALGKSVTATNRERMYIRALDHQFHYRFKEAGAVVDSMIALYPKDGELYVLRGAIFEYTKNFEEALEMYRKGSEVDTAYALATMSLGYAYSSRGDFDKAIEAMEQYIRLVPNEADPRASLADILMRVGRYDDAFAQYQKSLELKGDYWYSMAKIGEIYTLKGRLNDADKQFDLAMVRTVINNQTRASHLATEGILQYHRGKYDETVRLCEQSLSLDSTNGRAAYARVHALLKLKKFKEAEETIGRLRQELVRRNLSQSMAMHEFHLLRARFFEEQDLFDDALAQCDSALEYGSELTRSEVYQSLGRIYLDRGEYEKSLDALEGGLRYNPNSIEALLTLTKVYKKLGDRQMTDEIGGRLLDIWKNADTDYQNLVELKKVLGRLSSHTASS